MTLDVFEDQTRLEPCTQCGQPIPETTSAKRKERGNPETRCRDCLAVPVEYLVYEGFKCKPWHGEFDWDLMQPIREGKPYRTGFRLCGHADCVAQSHIIPYPEFYQIVDSMSAEAGRILTDHEITTRLKAERLAK
jgi:hypothetical protein